MKKRAFLAHSSVLASGMVTGPWLTASPAQARPDAALPRHTAAMPTPATTEFSAWQARLGEHFEVRSPLGRSVPLRLAEVASQPQAQPGVEQFRLSFEGPRHLPLGDGLHALQGANDTVVHLHLQPVRSAEGLCYQAHFSLLA